MVKAKVKGKAVLSESEQVKEDIANNAVVDATTAESESDPEELEAEEPVLVSVGEEEDGDNNSAGKEKEDDDNNSGGEEKEDGGNNSGGEEKEEDDDNQGGEEKDDDNNSGGKEKEADNHKEEVKNEEKVEKTLTKKDNKPRKRNKKKKSLGGAAADASKEGGKPETSNKNGASKKAEGMGMIFMCNSKTKKDCYQYKVLGLPAGKKDIVAKIYKGMRLFLYDFDLKLMYGIYKAAGPGGYNIEPKAFKSAFPSQVRFTVLEDCLPLPEEKFKKVIKENYSGRNKFDTQLNSVQVKNLCKLFLSNKGKPNRGDNPPPIRAELVRKFTDRGRNRPDRARRGPVSLDDRRIPKRPRIYEREPYQSAGAPPFSKRPRLYERDAYPSPPMAPPPQYSRLPPPLPPYERPLEVDYYRRDEQLEQRIRLLEMELKRRDETEYRDPYAAYKEREPPAYHIPREPPVPPTYHAPSYDPLYSASLAPVYAPPPLAPTSSSYYRL